MMSRRFMLATALGALMWSGAAGRAVAAVGAGRLPSDATVRALVGALGRPGSAAAVGRAFLARFPAEAAPARLAGAIVAGWAGEGFDPVRVGRRALRARLAGRVRDDFGAGRVVMVDGWVLAATEARLFALAALAQGPQRGGA